MNAEAHTGQRPRLVAAPGLRTTAVTTALEAVAAELHAVAVVTLDAATVQAAITASPQLGHVYAVWPPLVVVAGGAEVERPADGLVIGHLVRTDREASYAASPSNRILRGVLRTTPPVDWVVDARSSSANLLNRAFVATAIVVAGHAIALFIAEDPAGDGADATAPIELIDQIGTPRQLGPPSDAILARLLATRAGALARWQRTLISRGWLTATPPRTYRETVARVSARYAPAARLWAMRAIAEADGISESTAYLTLLRVDGDRWAAR